jgi:hypothetical protein
LERVEKAQGKREGGLEEYAKLIGKSLPAVSRFRAAAKVFIEIKNKSNIVNPRVDYCELHKLTYEVYSPQLLNINNKLCFLTDKTTHLYEIHPAPREMLTSFHMERSSTWPLLASFLPKDDWSV